jgi:hypothetical protein
LLRAGNTQPQQVLSSINVAPLEFPRRHAHIFRNAIQIVFRQVNEPLLLAAIGASGLALKSQRHHCSHAAIAHTPPLLTRRHCSNDSFSAR